MVEINDKKREWLNQQFPCTRCIFKDMRDMGHKPHSGDMQPVPKVRSVEPTYCGIPKAFLCS